MIFFLVTLKSQNGTILPFKKMLHRLVWSNDVIVSAQYYTATMSTGIY